jgi:hypothetical protein
MKVLEKIKVKDKMKVNETKGSFQEKEVFKKMKVNETKGSFGEKEVLKKRKFLRKRRF